ncbi:MAG: hypothetical protein ACJ74H_02140 [Thermoanaerobaculia bacterium]
MIWDGGELALDELPTEPLSATLTIPPAVPNGAWITLRTVTGGSTGTSSSSVAFLTGVPTGLVVEYDGTNISAAWDASNDSRVNAYQVTFTATGNDPVVETVYTTSWESAFTPDAGQTANVSVKWVAGLSSGADTTAVDAILNQPAITKAAFDGAELALGWSGVSDSAAEAYVVVVKSGGVAVSETMSGGTSTTIPFTAGADIIQIRALGASTAGPLSTSFSPITARPSLESISFDAATGSLTIAWDAISGASSYTIVFRSANVTVLSQKAETNTLTLTANELPASGIYDVTVQAFSSAGNDDVSGPASTSLPAVLLPPVIVAIAYDGRTARVVWEPITSASITGYVVTILSGTTSIASQTVFVPAAEISIAYASTNDYTVVVQALTSAGSGQPSAQAALFQAGWYPSTATSEASHITPASAASMSSYDIDVYLANIFTTYVSSGLPDDPPFVFSTADAPFSYKLTMPAASAVWTFSADAIRAGILASYELLLTKLAALNVTALGWRMVQDAISRAMPQTFAESLYYAYAFVPGEGYVDLRPGMLLRADFESYQYLGPDQTVSAYVDGFVSSSSAVYDVGSYVTSDGQWLTGFDAFLSLVTQSGSIVPAPDTDGSTSSGGGGIVDLYYSQFRKAFVRLVYPPQILGDSSSDARTEFNVAVLASDDYRTLGTATLNLRNAQPLPNDVAATYFRGRTTIAACIRIWLDGQPLVVSVGTTVANVLETMGRRPPVVISQSGTAGIPLSGIVLERSIGYAITDPEDGTNGYPVSRGMPIRLDWNQGMAYSASTDWLSLPLLPGDRIITRGSE